MKLEKKCRHLHGVNAHACQVVIFSNAVGVNAQQIHNHLYQPLPIIIAILYQFTLKCFSIMFACRAYRAYLLTCPFRLSFNI